MVFIQKCVCASWYIEWDTDSGCTERIYRETQI